MIEYETSSMNKDCLNGGKGVRGAAQSWADWFYSGKLGPMEVSELVTCCLPSARVTARVDLAHGHGPDSERCVLVCRLRSTDGHG